MEEPFDGVKIGAIAWQKMDLEVMPIESLSLVPAGVIDDEHSTFDTLLWNLLGQIIEVKLEDIGINSIKDHRGAFPGRGAHCANDIGSDMVSEVRHSWPASPSSPASPRTRIALDPALVNKP